jgi:hypothetical protein
MKYYVLRGFGPAYKYPMIRRGKEYFECKSHNNPDATI